MGATLAVVAPVHSQICNSTPALKLPLPQSNAAEISVDKKEHPQKAADEVSFSHCGHSKTKTHALNPFWCGKKLHRNLASSMQWPVLTKDRP